MEAMMKTGSSITTSVPGFRFHPTGEEMVSYFLKRKVENKPLPSGVIVEIDLYNHEPWELPDKSILKEKNQEYWYFFCLREKISENGKRMKRSTNQGYWKPTGKEKMVNYNSKLIGMKKFLVFYKGKAPHGLRTDWVMHEYRLAEEESGENSALQEYVLCKVFYKNNTGSPNEIPNAYFNEEKKDDAVDGNDVIAANHATVDENPELENSRVARIGFEKDIQTVDQGVACNNEDLRLDDWLSLCVPNTNAHLPYKRKQPNDSSSTTNNEDSRLDDWLSLRVPNTNAHLPYKRKQPNDYASTAKKAATSRTSHSSMTTITFSTLLAFPFSESIEPEENRSVPLPTYDTSNLESEVPPGCINIINKSRNENHNISRGKEACNDECRNSY